MPLIDIGYGAQYTVSRYREMAMNHNIKNSAVELPQAAGVIGLLSLVLLLLEVVR